MDKILQACEFKLRKIILGVRMHFRHIFTVMSSPDTYLKIHILHIQDTILNNVKKTSVEV